MITIATYNIKGGVGKTTTAVNLSYLAAETGARILVCDLDPQAAATYCFRAKPRIRGDGRALVARKRPLARHIRQTDHHGLDLLLAHFSYRHLDLLLDHSKYVRR
ncbi:MAG: AAA family ATPase [Acidobacteriota bacterium]|nr:AAA family ATPase [Acidobacteriota bacterium]